MMVVNDTGPLSFGPHPKGLSPGSLPFGERAPALAFYRVLAMNERLVLDCNFPYLIPPLFDYALFLEGTHPQNFLFFPQFDAV